MIGDALGSATDGRVIPGDPAEVRELAEHLTKLASAFGRVADGYRRLDTSSWTGKAAEAAREHLELAPKQWSRAQDAFDTAGTAVADYQRTLAECQPRAERAKEQLERATEASKKARQQHNDAVDAAESGNGPPPQPFSDPHAGEIAEARRTIEQCQQAVAQAGDRAAAAVRRAASEAPAEPGMLTKLNQSVTDGAQQLGRAGGSMVAGMSEGVKGMATFARTVSPFDPQMVTDPAGKTEAMSTMAASIGGTGVGLFTNTKQTVSTIVDAETWAKNPAKAAGTLVPDIALGAATGGGGAAASRAASVARRAGEVGRKAADKVGDGARKAGEKLRGGGEKPSTHAPDARPTPDGTPPWHGSDLPPAERTPAQPASTGQRPPESPGDVGGQRPPRDAHVDPVSDAPGPRPEVRAPSRRPMPDDFDDGQPASFLEDVHGSRPGQGVEAGRLGRLGGEDTPGSHARSDEPGAQHRSDGSETHGDRGPDERPGGPTRGNEAGHEFEEAQRYVDEHGDPIRMGQHAWDDLQPGGELPAELTKGPSVSSDNAAGEFLYRNVDPNESPLYRNHSGSLDDVFNSGVRSGNSDAPMNLETLGAHNGGSGIQTPYVSTSDSLGHVLARDGGLDEGNVILDIRDPGGHAIDVDATFKNAQGDRFMSHGEGEKVYAGGIPREHIKGGWQIVNGNPRRFENPNFDHSILEWSGP